MLDDLTSVNRGFISYTRADNDTFGQVVDRLKADLTGRFQAQTGRTLELFVDRDSIGWGEDWRQTIRGSVQAATVFIPIVTMRYFTSDACREELIAFHSNARQLGVTDLILPIVLAGADQIRDTDEREEVRLIESLNYMNIESAWVAGYDSPEWRRSIAEMVGHLSSALVRVEDVLATRELEAGMPSSDGSGGAPSTGQLEEEATADISSLGERVAAITETAEALGEALQAFADAASGAFPDNAGSQTPTQQKAKLLAAAHRLRGPAQDFGDRAALLEREVAAADAELRALIDELRAIDHPEANKQLNDLLSSFTSLEEMAGTLGQMDEMTQMLKFASVVNVNLRQAIKPAIRGMQASKTAISTVESWKQLQ